MSLFKGIGELYEAIQYQFGWGEPAAAQRGDREIEKRVNDLLQKGYLPRGELRTCENICRQIALGHEVCLRKGSMSRTIRAPIGNLSSSPQYQYASIDVAED